jgi:hypothetical protein
MIRASTRPAMLSRFAALAVAYGLCGATLGAQQPVLPADCTLEASVPHVAAGVDGTVAVVFAVGDAIWCSLAPEVGQGFGEPVPVGARHRLARGLNRGPKVAVTPGAVVVVAICGESLGGRDGDLLAWRSTDRGASWTGPVRVNDVPGVAREGLHAVAAAPDGRLFCAWLDLRHAGAEAGGTELWGAWSHDAGATWSEDLRVYASPDGTICECCHPSVAFDPSSGRAVVMWRNALAGNRDMYAVLLDERTVGEAISLDSEHWELKACPMAGGGLAVSSTGRLLTFWRRGRGLYTATPGLGEVELVGEGRQAAAAAGPDGFHLLWTDGEGRLLTALDSPEAAERRATSLGSGFHAWVAGAPDGHGPVLATWESGEEGGAALRYTVLAERREPDDL